MNEQDSVPIQSLQNPRVKAAIRLKDRRSRERSGLTRVDGARELLRALEARVQVEELFVCPERLTGVEAAELLKRAQQQGIPQRELSPAVYDKLAWGDRREGLCAVLRWTPRPLDQLSPGQDALILVIQGVEKPGNVGALLRSADAAGVEAVLVCGGGTDLANPNVVRASLGTLFSLPVAQMSSQEARQWLQGHGVRVLAATPEAEKLYWDCDLRGPLAVVVGAEHEGLDALWRDAEEKLRIPMSGRADSLNVSTSAAVLLFEARRQRSVASRGNQG